MQQKYKEIKLCQICMRNLFLWSKVQLHGVNKNRAQRLGAKVKEFKIEIQFLIKDNKVIVEFNGAAKCNLLLDKRDQLEIKHLCK